MNLIVDGQNLAFATNMTQELCTSSGHPTHATLGFLRSLGSAASRFSANAIYVAWDGGVSPQRLALYPDYKSNRKVLQNDAEWVRRRVALDKQIIDIRELLTTLGIKQVWGDGLEGDDIIALLARSMKMRCQHSVIVSADKDFWQLVCLFTSVFNPINNGSKVKLVSMNNFSEVTGLDSPAQYLDFKSMVGDASDGIAGCKGVGEKTARDILRKYGSYDRFFLEARGQKLPALQKRAYDDSVGFQRSKTLMDLKNPLCERASNVKVEEGQCDLGKFSDRMAKLEIKAAGAIGDFAFQGVFKSYLEANQ